MVAALKKHSFHVIEGFDLDRAAFERKVREFSAALNGAEAGLFFYAGHGMQVAGQNYLVPIDARAENEDALDWEMLKVEVVHRAMERSTNTNILFLDACRDNPLARNLAKAMGTRSSFVGRGLATFESGVGTLISFSTQPGNVALDGTGRNSPFAGALVKQLLTSNEDMSAMLIAVRNDVMKETQRKQVPWEHSALTGRFYFKGADALAHQLGLQEPRRSDLSQTEGGGRSSDLAQVHTLVGGHTLELFGGQFWLSMLGTPYGGRRNLVGVTVRGQRMSMSQGQFILVKRPSQSCTLRLDAIKEGKNAADFVLTCRVTAIGPQYEGARMVVELRE